MSAVPALAQQQQPVAVQLTAPAVPAAPVVAAVPAPAMPAASAAAPASQAQTAGTPSLAPASPAGGDDTAVRTALAQKLQALMPANVLLESAIAAQSQSLPEKDRAAFHDRIIKAIDPKRLEVLSVKTMVDLFSTAELQRMLDYFGSPEARFIAQKMQTYQNMLQPEIAKMLENALTEVRPEGAAASVPAAKTP